VLRARAVTAENWPVELEQAWKELAQNSPAATPFQTWEWHTSWWKQYKKARKPYIVTIHEGEDLVGLMPLMISGGPWRTLRAMATGASDYLHPLSRTGYEQEVAQELKQHISEMEGIDVVDLHQIRETFPLAQGKDEARTLDQATCLVLDLPNTFDAYLATLNKSLRYDVRKLDKELFKSGRASIEEITEDNLTRGMDTFFHTHKQRWRKRGLPGAFVGSKRESFHRDWSLQAIRNGWLWLSVLHYDGQPVGTIYAMKMGQTCFYFQAGMDPAASSISPGSLLVGYTIRKAIQEGLTTFDFLRGDEPYKRRWKPQHEYKNVRIITTSKGLWGKAGQAWNDMGGKIENRVRARLEGRGLLQ
jgi:CelD/BcsL family acetyltransferase involved in cellulose biosynthesis